MPRRPARCSPDRRPRLAPRPQVWIDRLTRAAFLLLWVATLLAVASLANYMHMAWHFFRYPSSSGAGHR